MTPTGDVPRSIDKSNIGCWKTNFCTGKSPNGRLQSVLKQFRVALDNLLHSFPVDTGDVYVVTVFSEETTEGGHVMAVPRKCGFDGKICARTSLRPSPPPCPAIS